MDADLYPKPAEAIVSWDFEADVVIAGYGIAGAAAAVEAASVGADVLVVERTGGWGGAAAIATAQAASITSTGWCGAVSRSSRSSGASRAGSHRATKG
jgi:heterodisulfide reductase subunit A-like polyferredoxin